jgi:hypothetical protein
MKLLPPRKKPETDAEFIATLEENITITLPLADWVALKGMLHRIALGNPEGLELPLEAAAGFHNHLHFQLPSNLLELYDETTSRPKIMYEVGKRSFERLTDMTRDPKDMH